MKVFKYILIFALPILLFVNVWRAVSGSDNVVSIGTTIDYVKGYRGFQTCYSMWSSMASNISSGEFWQTILGILQFAISPITFVVGLLADIVYNVWFFFNWIFDWEGNVNLTSSNSGYSFGPISPITP